MPAFSPRPVAPTGDGGRVKAIRATSPLINKRQDALDDSADSTAARFKRNAEKEFLFRRGSVVSMPLASTEWRGWRSGWRWR
jgi:hypothetical protein